MSFEKYYAGFARTQSVISIDTIGYKFEVTSEKDGDGYYNQMRVVLIMWLPESSSSDEKISIANTAFMKLPVYEILKEHHRQNYITEYVTHVCEATEASVESGHKIHVVFFY